MAGLISTGVWGFICSAAMRTGKITATFISGATGWIIKNNGEAEFKSIYARDKIITNEYVYNRIRVTEDEEVVTSNGKILASFENEDGTYNIQLDLREGDLNPFTANDLLQGYYHSPGNTGVIYAVQKMTVIKILDDQTMNVICLGENLPYKYMVIVRVGNTRDVERQAFIRISSRTNCQYFYDEIASFADLDNPDKVKCALGKADVGLIPAWATKVTGSVKRWFGLVADGVILRGTFILKNDKTIEEELSGQIKELSGKFEIRESGITGKWEETIQAAGSAAKSVETVTKMVGDFQVTAEHLTAAFSETVTKATTDAAGTISIATETATSSLNRTAEELQDSFEKSFTDAEGEITKQIKTQVTQNAKQWKVEVMGADAGGNPNTILAAINADESGVQIEGEKVKITGTLLAQIIMATGLNIQDKFIVSIDDNKQAHVSVKGRVEANEGVFYGSIAVPPQEIPNNLSDLTLSFENGFNFSGLLSNGIKRIFLPTTVEYVGVECSIINYGEAANGYYEVKTVGNNAFLYSGTPRNRNTINSIKLYGTSQLKLKAIKVNNSIRWFIDNYNDFSFDYINSCITNGMPSQLARCLGSYWMNSQQSVQTISCSDGNVIKLSSYDNCTWTFSFTKPRPANRNYTVVPRLETKSLPVKVLDKNSNSFRIQLYFEYVMGIEGVATIYVDGGGWGFDIFEFDT